MEFNKGLFQLMWCVFMLVFVLFAVHEADLVMLVALAVVWLIGFAVTGFLTTNVGANKGGSKKVGQRYEISDSGIDREGIRPSWSEYTETRIALVWC